MRLHEQIHVNVSKFFLVDGAFRGKHLMQQEPRASGEHRIVKYVLKHLQLDNEAPPFLLGMGVFFFPLLPCPLYFAR